MNECYSLLLIFLLFFFRISSSLIHRNEFLLLLSNRTIEHVCENDVLSLRCLKSNETIQIIRSMYGRTSQRICNENYHSRLFEKTCANIEQSKNQIKQRCQGQSTCEVLINNKILTDPCGKHIFKHFEVHYRCINQEEICSKLILNCSQSKDIHCIKQIHEEFSCQCPSTICQYVNNQPIDFVEQTCPQEYSWPKTPIHQIQTHPCPLPCSGRVTRACNSDQQWSKANYNNCQCSFTELSTNHFAIRHIYQCKNFWLINRLLPKDNSCLLSFPKPKTNDEQQLPIDCLINSFQQMKSSSCLNMSSFEIDFENLRFQIDFSFKNVRQIEFSSYQIEFSRTRIVQEHFQENLPILFIDKPQFNSTNHSFYLIEQKNDLQSIQTANLTIIFRHQSADFRYQCRASHSIDFNRFNMFFACQLICTNQTHVICQCPFFNPMMSYSFDIDRTTTINEILIENELNNRCLGQTNRSIEEKIDRYIDNVSSLEQAKKILLLIDRQMKHLNTNIFEQIENLSNRLIINQTNLFSSIENNLDFYIKSNEYQLTNVDQSIFISIYFKERYLSNFRMTFSTLKFDSNRFVYFDYWPKNVSINQIELTYRHLNTIDSNLFCESFSQNHWQTDFCQLTSTNLTHSICLCKSNVHIFRLKSNIDHRLIVSKIGCLISLICLLFTLFLLIFRRSHLIDELANLRNIFHINMLLCLIIVQIFFLIGIHQYKNQIFCRIVSILIDYFLLSTFSWMFSDEIELLISLKQDFKFDRIRFIAYTIYSYLFPLITILFSRKFSQKPQVNRYCWLSYENNFLWTFAVPFILLMIGNFCLFLISIYSICKNSEKNDSKNSIRFSLRNLSLISILFGLTWIIALFYLYDQSLIFAYLFTILNSSHGFLILIFYCLMSKHIRNLFVEKSFETYTNPDNTSSSGYSSEHSADMLNRTKLETCYLPSIPITLLSNRLSTFRYDEMILSHEQLLRKTTIHDDEHQYYEIS